MAAGAFQLGAQAVPDQRTAPREEVFYRTRASTASGIVQLQIVNISASGFMARSESDFTEGEQISLRLPVVGTVAAEVRWSLGGRLGGQFDRMIGLANYLDLLSEMVSNTR